MEKKYVSLEKHRIKIATCSFYVYNYMKLKNYIFIFLAGNGDNF